MCTHIQSHMARMSNRRHPSLDASPTIRRNLEVAGRLLSSDQPALRKRRLEMRDALRGVSQRRRFLRILLRLEHDPARIAPQFTEHADIIDDAVARRGVDPE